MCARHSARFIFSYPWGIASEKRHTVAFFLAHLRPLGSALSLRRALRFKKKACRLFLFARLRRLGVALYKPPLCKGRWHRR